MRIKPRSVFELRRLNEISICRVGEAGIEEWTLYRATEGDVNLAKSAFLEHEEYNGQCFGNPASCYCEQVGGEWKIASDQKLNEYGICHFPDQTAIEEFALFRGPTDTRTAELTKLLK